MFQSASDMLARLQRQAGASGAGGGGGGSPTSGGGIAGASGSSSGSSSASRSTPLQSLERRPSPPLDAAAAAAVPDGGHYWASRSAGGAGSLANGSSVPHAASSPDMALAPAGPSTSSLASAAAMEPGRTSAAADSRVSGAMQQHCVGLHTCTPVVPFPPQHLPTHWHPPTYHCRAPCAPGLFLSMTSTMSGSACPRRQVGVPAGGLGRYMRGQVGRAWMAGGGCHKIRPLPVLRLPASLLLCSDVVSPPNPLLNARPNAPPNCTSSLPCCCSGRLCGDVPSARRHPFFPLYGLPRHALTRAQPGGAGGR